MKRFVFGFLVLTVAGAAGCSNGTEDSNGTARPAAGAGTADAVPAATAEQVVGEAEHTFSLSVPFESVALTQGKETSVRIGINRGENFGEQVGIQVAGLPEGVTVETKEPVITIGSKGVELTFKATSDAALGDFTATVTGQTESSSADFSEEIKLTVSQE